MNGHYIIISYLENLKNFMSNVIYDAKMGERHSLIWISMLKNNPSLFRDEQSQD